MSSFYRGFSVVARMPVSVSTTCAAYSGILGFTERVRGSHHIFRRGASPRESICNVTIAMQSPIRCSKCGE